MMFLTKQKLKPGLKNSEAKTRCQGSFQASKQDNGLACALVYKDGVLEAITRGDGFVGEDVTSNVKTI